MEGYSVSNYFPDRKRSSNSSMSERLRVMTPQTNLVHNERVAMQYNSQTGGGISPLVDVFSQAASKAVDQRQVATRLTMQQVDDRYMINHVEIHVFNFPFPMVISSLPLIFKPSNRAYDVRC